MMEAEQPGMQRLAREIARRLIGHGLRRVLRARRLAGAAIGRIADQRMAQMGQMHADLMGAPGLQPALDQAGERPRAETLDHAVARARELAAGSHHRHALADARIASDLALDDPLPPPRAPPAPR